MRSNGMLRRALRDIGTIGDRLSLARDVFLGVDRSCRSCSVSSKDWIMAELQQTGSKRSARMSPRSTRFRSIDKVQFLLDAVLGFINIAQNDLFRYR